MKKRTLKSISNVTLKVNGWATYTIVISTIVGLIANLTLDFQDRKIQKQKISNLNQK